MTEGDLRRFAEMHERHFKQLKVFATRYLGGTCMAEDVVQAAFGQFIPYFDTRKNEEAWLAWLRKAIYRNCLKVWRERQLFRKHTPSVAVDDSVDNSPDRWMEITEDARRNALLVEKVKVELSKLDPKWQIAITLKVRDGWTYKEIAEFLEVPQNTVGSWIYRGLMQVRDACRAKNGLND